MYINKFFHKLHCVQKRAIQKKNDRVNCCYTVKHV